MKAQDLLNLVKESSKGTKHVDGELKTPSYDNLNTPDNHVDGKGTKEVKNAKKDLGKRRDKKNPANPGTPRKTEKGRQMGGPPKSYKRMNEQGPRSAEDVLMNTKRSILKSVQTMDRAKGTMTVAQRSGKPVTIQMDPETMKGALADVLGQIKRSQEPKEIQQLWGKFLQQASQQGSPTMKPRASSGHSVGKPMTAKTWMNQDMQMQPKAGGQGTRASFGDSEGDEPEEMEESYADSGSMKWEQPVKKGGPVSKTAKVRGKVDDEPTNKADPGKPKNDGKGQMGDGANLGKVMNPKSVKKVEEGLKGLEKLLGRKLGIKPSFNRGSMSVQEAMDPTLAQYLRTALWSSTDMNTDMPMNHDYDLDDFSAEALRLAQSDLLKFKAALSNDLSDELHMPSVAHDLWLARNGHSHGFTDDDYSPEVGKLMTKIAHQMGEIHLVVGENNQIQFFNG